MFFFFFSSRRRHTRFSRDWSSDVCSSDLPGMQAAHYAPRARIVLADASSLASVAERERGSGHSVVVLAPGTPALSSGIEQIRVPETLGEYARVLYRTLREVDRRQFDVAVVQIQPLSGLGLAIRDRLTRAAAAKLDQQP